MHLHRLRRAPANGVVLLLRALAVILALALLVSGCGGSDKPATVDRGGSTATDKKDDEPVTVEETDPSDEPDPVAEEPAPDPGYQAPRAGQCFQMTPAQSRASVAIGPKVGCKRPHNTVVAYVGYLARAVTPKSPLAKRRALGNRLCEPAYSRLVGGTPADRATSILTWTLFTPDQAQLERGARWVRCDVLARSLNELIPLPPGKPLLAAGVPEQLRVCQNEAGADISCSRPHAFRVDAVYPAFGEAYPESSAYTATARALCKQLTNQDGGYWQPPSQQGWQAGDRFIRCLSAQQVIR